METSTYRHKHIPTMTMTIIGLTDKGYKCLVTDPNGKGKVRTGKTEFFDRQDVKGDRAVWEPVYSSAPST